MNDNKKTGSGFRARPIVRRSPDSPEYGPGGYRHSEARGASSPTRGKSTGTKSKKKNARASGKGASAKKAKKASRTSNSKPSRVSPARSFSGSVSYARRDSRDDLTARIEAARKRSEQKRKIAAIRKKKRRIRRFLLFLLVCAVGAGLYYGGRYIKRHVLTDAIESIPTIRAEALTRFRDHLLVSDTTGRQLTPAEKQADASKLKNAILESVPFADAPGVGAKGFREQLDKLTAEAVGSKNDAEFLNRLEEMVKLLNDPLSAVITWQAYDKLLPRLGHGFYEPGSAYANAIDDGRVRERYARMKKESGQGAAQPAQAQGPAQPKQGAPANAAQAAPAKPGEQPKQEKKPQGQQPNAAKPEGQKAPAANDKNKKPAANDKNKKPAANDKTKKPAERAVTGRWIGETGLAVFSGFDFNAESIVKDRAAIISLFREYESAKTIILDLRGVDGTSDAYWCKDIAPIIVPGDTGTSTTLFFRNGFNDYIDYLSVRENIMEFDLEDDRGEISMLLPQPVQAALADMDYSKKITFSVSQSNDVTYPRRVVLLTDETTKNAADTFASFCKETGVASVAGRKTGGGGWEVPPFFLKLDHSGYLVQLHTSTALAPSADGLQDKLKTTPNIILDGDDLLGALAAALQ